MELDRLYEVILAAGGLGIAAFGIVEGLKWSRLGVAGFDRGLRLLGELTSALEVAYGRAWAELLKAQYRQGRTTGELPRTLRQGIRAGLTEANAVKIARHLDLAAPQTLREAAQKVEAGKAGDLSDRERNVIGRFELAADTRIEAALGLADSRYVVAQRVAAGIVALGVALFVAALITGFDGSEPGNARTWGFAALVGLSAVPLAPISKDVVSALQAAQQALRSRQ